MECVQCYKVFTRSDNLRRHMKIHDRHQPYPNVKLFGYEPYPNLKRQDSDISPSSEVFPSRKQLISNDEDRVGRSEVLYEDIFDLIGKYIVMPEELKDDIWNEICNHSEFERGGSIGEEKENDKQNDKVEEEEKENDKQSEEVEEEKETEEHIKDKVFRDVIIKDKNKLEEMINVLQESKFSEQAGEIKDLFHQYLTDGDLRLYHHVRGNYYAEGYEAIVEKIFNKLRALERGGKSGPALRMQVLVQAIENVRRVIDKLFSIMEGDEKQKGRALLRLVRPNGITWEEHLIFDKLNPEIVKSVLKERETKLF